MIARSELTGVRNNEDADPTAVSGETNLPDGALVTILVGRNAQFEGEEARNFHMGGDGVKVAGGAFQTDVTPDEGILEMALQDESSFGPVEAVSDTVTVCAKVRPNDDQESPQPTDVMEAIGKGGENFKSSPQKSEFGDVLRLEAVTTALMPSETIPPSVPHKRRVGEVFCA